MSWFCSVCEKSFSRKDSMQRHANVRTPQCWSHPISNRSDVFTEMSVVSLWASLHLHDCWNDQVRKSGLGSISITSSFSSNLPSPREDRLVLFTMVACVYRNAGRHATHWIHQGNFYGFGAGFLFWCEQTESDRVWWSDDWRRLILGVRTC